MRLDLFLKASRLIPRRSLAQEFCEKGLVRVNETKAKASKEIKTADTIEIKRRNRKTTIRILAVPQNKQVSKAAAEDLYEILADEITEADPILS
jgi:Ribosome-associated heat shock protein implicated in the recycling of the 50S subunit (S4 paralog)